MLKKLLAAVTAAVLGLGIVALTATPASAHDNRVTADCQAVTVNLWAYGGRPHDNHLTVEIDGVTVEDTDFGDSFGPKDYAFTAPLATHVYSVIVDARDHNYDVNKIDQHVTGCLPDDTNKKIQLCHWDGGDPVYTLIEVSKNSVLHGGHGDHEKDIIPPFDYVQDGVSGHYPGKNWDATGQALFANGCDDLAVVPAAPSFSEGVCVAAGTVGQGGYTIPATTGVSYKVKLGNGSWTPVSAGTYPAAVGSRVQISAIAQPGYVIPPRDDSSWDEVIGGPDSSDCVVPAAPTFSPSECVADQPGGQTGAGYTIPTSPDVRYELLVNGSWQPVSAGTHVVTSYPTTVKIRAVPTGDAVIVPGSTTAWEVTFASAGDCLVTALPAAPSFDAAVCEAPGELGQGSYTIPALATGIARYEVAFSADGPWTEDASTGTHAVAAGTHVYVRAIPAPGYTIPGQNAWDEIVGQPETCIVTVPAPAEASYDEAVCTGPGASDGAGYTLTGATGVHYLVSTDGVDYEPASAVDELVDVEPGTELWIQPVADEGYAFAEPIGPWHHEFAAVGDCLVEVPAIGDPTFVDQSCSIDDEFTPASFTVEPAEHASYEWSVDGSDFAPLEPGEHAAGTLVGKTVVIRAIADAGYSLGDGVSEWTHAFSTEGGDCLATHPVVTPVATSAAATCTTARTVTLSTLEGIDGAVQWTINGQPAQAGTQVAPAGALHIVASPALDETGEPYGLLLDGSAQWSDDSQTAIAWDVPAAAAPDCELQTFALTGSDPTVPLGLAGALLAAGALVIALSRRQARRS